jgi:tetratricopeptide (TPR) repeat protein
MSDAPSGGSAVPRPKMNEAAARAYAAGTQAFQNGDLEAASTNFTDATSADATAYQAHYSLGVVRERLGNGTGAMSAYSRAISVVPDYEPAIIAYGVLLARQGNAEGAEQYLNQHLAKMDRSAAVTTALAEVRSIRGDSGAAQRLAREALKINPDYRPAMVTIARDHYRARRLELALYALQGILDGYGAENPPRDRDNPDALMLRGLILKERGQRGAAIKDLRRCIELRPDLVEARVHLAGYYLESGNAVEATPLLEAALRFDRDNLLARQQLGDSYRLLGRVEEAKKQLEWVVEVSPNMPEVHYALGLLFLFADSVPGVSQKAAVERAMTAFEQYKKLRPRSGVGQSDDVDELINAAKSKKAIIEANEAEQAAAAAAAAAAPPPAPDAPVVPAAPQPPAKSGAADMDAADSKPAPVGAPPSAPPQPAPKPRPSTGSLDSDEP